MNRVITSITGLGLASFIAALSACSSDSDPPAQGTGGNTTVNGGSVGQGGSVGNGGTVGQGGTVGKGGSVNPNGGTGNNSGAAPGSGGTPTSGGSGNSPGSGGTPPGAGTGNSPATGGTSGGAPAETGGSGGSGNAAGSPPVGGGANPGPATVLVTSTNNAWWKVGMFTEAASGTPAVTVNDTAAQNWDGFAGAFNELGWQFLTTKEMQDEAIKLLFSATDGANFAWGRIPMGSSDYGKSRYTLADTGTDVEPNADESNRPPADTALAMFSLTRDGMLLIPYIKAALAVKPELRFWASPWTPPVWMKTGYKKNSGQDSSQNAKRPSYFDGGTMKSDEALLAAYAQYFKKFVEGYKAEGINIEIVSPQNEPGYDQNYPSCLWDKATFTTFIGKHLGPAMMPLGVKVMLGTMSNAGDANRNDVDIATAVLADATAKSFLAVAGVQWGVLDKVNQGTTFGGLPIWASEHKCGNYPWETSKYNSAQAPNDLAYGNESWGYIRNAIKQGKVTSYNTWNMVLDKSGLGIDTTRDWKQNALLVADGGKVNPTPTYYVFRHLSQYVVPGAKVVGTSGGDAVAFKNPDGSYVAVLYNSGGANPNYVVSMGGKNLQFDMPGQGWATVKYTP
jgi:glucosylceramidase